MSGAPPALRFSHVGLFVTDMARMVEFYCDGLGFVVTDQGRLGGALLTFLTREPGEHHQLVLVEGRPAGLPGRIVNQLSFRVDALSDLIAFWHRIRERAPADLVAVTHGNAWSVYFGDPEGNRIEVFADTPWHVSQPVREPLDLESGEAAILAETEAFCRGRPGFRPMAEWRREVAARLADQG